MRIANPQPLAPNPHCSFSSCSIPNYGERPSGSVSGTHCFEPGFNHRPRVLARDERRTKETRQGWASRLNLSALTTLYQCIRDIITRTTFTTLSFLAEPVVNTGHDRAAFTCLQIKMGVGKSGGPQVSSGKVGSDKGFTERDSTPTGSTPSGN